MKHYYMYCFLLAVIFLATSVHSECKLNSQRDFGPTSPLLIKNSTFVYPKRETPRSLKFETNETLHAYCPGRTTANKIQLRGHFTGHSRLTIKCQAGSHFLAPTHADEFSNIHCNTYPESRTRIVGVCGKVNDLIEIGFQTTKNGFKPLILVCHNQRSGRTIWAHTVMTGAIAGRQTAGVPPHFRTAGFFRKMNMARIYSRAAQREQMLKIFHTNNQSQVWVNHYMPADSDYYFARGHLIARADMYYTSQQFATFYYLNTAPMWQAINKGNWLLVEEKIRGLASKYGDLEIWAGVMDYLNLAGSQGDKVIYLSSYKSHIGKEGLMFVPELLFKIAYHRPSHRAVVYFTLNNPYKPYYEPHHLNGYGGCREDPICRENEPRFDEFLHGYTYCCNFSEFYTFNAQADGLGLTDLGNPRLLQ